MLASLTSNALSQIYATRFGLTIPGWRVIVTLGQYGVRTARDIAAHGVMHKSTVSRAVALLEGRGCSCGASPIRTTGARSCSS